MNKIKILRIISLGLSIPAIASFILWWVGSLDIKIMATINWIVFTVEFILFLFVTKSSRTNYTGVIIPKGSCEEKKIMAGTNIFPDFLVSTNIGKDCTFRINLQIKEFKKFPLFYLVRSYENDIFSQELNKDIKLDTGMVHIFEVVINCKEKLNFKFDEDVIIQKLYIEELYNV